MDFEKVLRAFLAKAYKMQDGDIDAILEASKEDQAALLQALYDKDKTRVSELTKPKDGQTFQDGYKKAKKEVLTELEAELKTTYGVDTEATGLDLIGEIVTAKGKKTKELTDDDVKKHPVYQTLEKGVKKQVSDLEKNWQEKLTAAETGFKKAQVFGTVSEKALQELEALNPIFPANATVAANLKKAYLNALKDGYEFDNQESGIVIMRDGKVVDDGHGHTLDFAKFAKDKAAEFFEFKVNNGGGNGGNGPDKDKTGGGTGGTNYPANIQRPKSWDELNKIISDTSIKAEDRETVLKGWDQDVKAGTAKE